MPKERIFGSELPYGDDEPARSIIEIGWHRDIEHVEVATKCIDGVTGDDWHPPLEVIDESLWTPRPFSGSDTSNPAMMPPVLELEGLARSGHYVQLDRRGINEMIRVLRRARDQAFEKDE